MKIRITSLLVGLFAVMIPLATVSAAFPIPIYINQYLSVVTPVPTPSVDTTPSFTFKSTKMGTLQYPGVCQGNETSIGADEVLTVTFDQLPIGVYEDCSIRLSYTEMVNGFFTFKTETLNVPDFEIIPFMLIDIIPPNLAEETAVVTPTIDKTPNYTFSSNEAGTIAYEGACSSTTTAAVAGNNTITFNTLAPGTYTNCKIRVTDSHGNQSSALSVSSFTIQAVIVNPMDVTAPTLSMVSPVSTPTTDTTPNLTFASNEAGTISYSGSCSSDEVDAVDGNNTITLKNLATGTYTNCTLRVTDASSNASSWLTIPTFVITTNSTNPPVNPPTSPNDYCAGFSDVSKTDSDCDAIEYVKSIGAMTGNPNGTFEPEEYLQRDQVAKISLETFNLFSSSQDYCDGKKPFPDVSSSTWSFQYICRGVDLGMITGYDSGADAGYYRPSRSVNRVEFLALILRNLDGNMPSISSSSYTDVAKGLWYSGFAKFSYDNSLFTGSYLYPERFVRRVEVANVLFQLHEIGEI